MIYLFVTIFLISSIYLIILFRKNSKSKIKPPKLSTGEPYDNTNSVLQLNPSKIIAIIISVSSFLLTIYCLSSVKSYNEDITAPATIEETNILTEPKNYTQEKADEPYSEAPAQVPTLHITPTEFQQKYNEYLSILPFEDVNPNHLILGIPVLRHEPLDDIVEYTFNDLQIGMKETIDKSTGEIKEIVIIAYIAGQKGEDVRTTLLFALAAYNAAILAIDPNANTDDIAKGLDLYNKVSEWAKDTDTAHGNFTYFKRVFVGYGLAFGVSAEPKK